MITTVESLLLEEEEEEEEEDELIKYEIFPKIRIIRSFRHYQKTLWWKLSVLLSSCLKDFPIDNGNDRFCGFFSH